MSIVSDSLCACAADYDVEGGFCSMCGRPPRVPRFDETRITDPATGGAKGSKQAQLGWIDPLALLELARVAGYGADKYSDGFNYLRGFKWSLSYNALQRHILAFWSGEDMDPQMQLSHAAAAAWHCLCLLSFQLRGIGTDDRPEVKK